MGATESSSGLCDASMDRAPPRMPQKFPYYQAVCPPSLISRNLFDVPLRRAIIKTPHKEGAALDGGKGDDDVTSAVQSTSEKLGRFKGEAERQAYLEGDPRAEEVRPYEVLCKTCKKWVQLGNRTRYSLGRWKEHQKRCSGSM
jgi:hypothetical protein